MLNFELEPFEWQMSMNVIMENVDLEKIEFASGNSVLFNFSDTCGVFSHKKLLCTNVWKFSFANNLDERDTSPLFIGDVRVTELMDVDVKSAFDYVKYEFADIPISDKYTLVCMDSGEIHIILICQTVSEQ